MGVQIVKGEGEQKGLASVTQGSAVPLAHYTQFVRDKIRSKDETMCKIGGVTRLCHDLVDYQTKVLVQVPVLCILEQSTNSVRVIPLFRTSMNQHHLTLIYYCRN